MENEVKTKTDRELLYELLNAVKKDMENTEGLGATGYIRRMHLKDKLDEVEAHFKNLLLK